MPLMVRLLELAIPPVKLVLHPMGTQSLSTVMFSKILAFALGVGVSPSLPLTSAANQ